MWTCIMTEYCKIMLEMGAPQNLSLVKYNINCKDMNTSDRWDQMITNKYIHDRICQGCNVLEIIWWGKQCAKPQQTDSITLKRPK